MALTLTNTLNGKTTIVAQDIDDNFADITAKFNGGIGDADVDTNAAIQSSKLSENQFHIYVPLSVHYEGAAIGWPGSNTVVALAALPGPSGVWNVDEIIWACTNTGDAAGAFRIHFGDAAEVEGLSGTWICLATTISNRSGADDYNSATVTPSESTITLASGDEMFALVGTTASAATMDLAHDNFNATVRLSRQITS